MNKIKKIAENVYYSIFNIVDYANYTFFHFFFGADIVTKVVVVALALVGLFFLVKALFSLAVTLAMKVVSIMATLVLKAILFLMKWCCTIKVDIENSKGQYIEKDKQEATKDDSESTKIQHGI